jgi:phosphoglycolate phosphatase (TIGR01487 family)
MRPLAVDIDGTLTHSDRSLDARVLDPLREWSEPVVIATGKALPYPVGLCEFIGIPGRVIAENGGAVYLADDDDLAFPGDADPETARTVVEQYVESGHSLGWGDVDFVNRWRETEVAVNHDQPLAPLREIAEREGMRVFDTGYAYHVTAPAIDKGVGLSNVAERLDYEPDDFAVVGDSENDAAMFEIAGAAHAVANADDRAKAAADHITDGSFADGLLEALDVIRADD